MSDNMAAQKCMITLFVCMGQMVLMQATLVGLVKWLNKTGWITWQVSPGERKILSLAGCLQEVCLLGLWENSFADISRNECLQWTGHFLKMGSLAVFAGLLLFACVMDLKEQKVFHFVWWLAAGAVLLPPDNMMKTAMVDRVGILLYLLLQEFLFCYFYGRADAHAFGACGLLFGTLGAGMTDCFAHMTLSFLLLIPVQLANKNVDRNGRLKKPIAFLPYITASFWIVLVLRTWWTAIQ